MLGNVTWDGAMRHDGDTTDVHKILGNGSDFSDRLKAPSLGLGGGGPGAGLGGGGSTVLGSSHSSGTSVNSATSLYNSSTSIYHISDGLSKLPIRRVT